VLANSYASVGDATCYKDFLDPNWSLNKVTVYANETKVLAVHLSTSNLLRQYGNPKNATKVQSTNLDWSNARLMGIWGNQ
jgi:hypothetical protein